jgi:SAM-dependent methyltransferase
MHEASFEKMRAVRSAYFSSNVSSGPIRVLDVGSGCAPGSLTYGELFKPPCFTYVGLDIMEGHNVDVVPEDIFSWETLTSESFELVVSGQMLEHNPYFWVTLAEMARVTVAGGLIVCIAPSTGNPHRFPYDCWRFYPDSWASMCEYIGLELIEAYRERKSWRKTIPGTYWRDAMMIARKPVFDNESAQTRFHERLAEIVSTRRPGPEPVRGRHPLGAAGRLYEETHTLSASQVIWRPNNVVQLVTERLEPIIRKNRWIQEARERVWARDGQRALSRGAARMKFDRQTEGRRADQIGQ